MFAPYKFKKKNNNNVSVTPLADSPNEVDDDFSDIQNLISLTDVNSNNNLQKHPIEHNLVDKNIKNKHKLNLVQKFNSEDNLKNKDDYDLENDVYFENQVEPIRIRQRDRRSLMTPLKSSFECLTKSEIFIIAGVSWLLLIMILLVLLMKS